MNDICVLIVDDSAVMRKIVERTLRQSGVPIASVLEAASGAQALELLKQQQRVDLVLTDINMPEMDGLEFLRLAREQNLAPDTPFVMITTESSEERVMEAIGHGAQGYIRKPFTAEQVIERVVPLLNMSVS